MDPGGCLDLPATVPLTIGLSKEISLTGTCTVINEIRIKQIFIGTKSQNQIDEVSYLKHSMYKLTIHAHACSAEYTLHVLRTVMIDHTYPLTFTSVIAYQ